MKVSKRMRLVGLIVFSTVVLFLGYSALFGTSLARITLKVTDEKGELIHGAKVGVGFRVYTQGGWGSKQKGVDGTTNKEGNFSSSAFSDNFVGFHAKKERYYPTYGSYKFEDHSFGRWFPWNPEITVVLRKMENPVPMYQRDTRMMLPVLEIPVSGKEVGFDLIESDWVNPYGKGIHPDMIFRLDRQFINWDDFDGKLTITFPNRYDGIQLVKYNRESGSGSGFKLPRFAPEDGYQSRLVRTFGKKPGESFQKDEEDRNYFMRVRSEEKDGRLVRAMYGKIHGDIQFGMRGHKTASILFKYFLNPDHTRNLENGKNLLKLPEREPFNAN